MDADADEGPEDEAWDTEEEEEEGGGARHGGPPAPDDSEVTFARHSGEPRPRTSPRRAVPRRALTDVRPCPPSLRVLREPGPAHQHAGGDGRRGRPGVRVAAERRGAALPVLG